MIQPAFQKWYIFTSLLLLGSCGPSIEEKARQLALRDSFSIDSALKKEAVVKRTFLHKAKLRKDSVLKAAHDSLLRRADSTKAADSLPAKALKQRTAADSLRRHSRPDTTGRYLHQVIHKRTSRDTFHKKRIKNPVPVKDSSTE